MTSLISKAAIRFTAWLEGFQVKQLFSIVLAGFLALTAHPSLAASMQTPGQKAEQAIQQNDAQRPKTTGQWNKEARQTEDKPGERIQKIAGEATEAIKEWASVYPETAERSTQSLQNN